MDYKEKYEKALERARMYRDNAKAVEEYAAVARYENIFPELRESEDERIRKGLIEALKTSKTVGELKFVLPEPTREECIAYLEKQKPTGWSEEDERMLDEVLNRVTYAFYDQGNEGEIEDDPAYLWLHRLRPSWKPSEEPEEPEYYQHFDPNC